MVLVGVRFLLHLGRRDLLLSRNLEEELQLRGDRNFFARYRTGCNPYVQKGSGMTLAVNRLRRNYKGELQEDILQLDLLRLFSLGQKPSNHRRSRLETGRYHFPIRLSLSQDSILPGNLLPKQLLQRNIDKNR